MGKGSGASKGHPFSYLYVDSHLPSYKTDLKRFIPSVTKRQERLGNIFSLDQEGAELSKRNSTKTRNAKNLVLSFCFQLNSYKLFPHILKKKKKSRANALWLYGILLGFF